MRIFSRSEVGRDELGYAFVNIKSMFGNKQGIHRSDDCLLPLEKGFLAGDLYS